MCMSQKTYLQKLVVGKRHGAFQQRLATLLLGEQCKAQTIRGVQLFAEKIATRRHHGCELQQTSGG